MVHLENAGTPPPHVSVSANSELATMLVIVKAVERLLARVIFCAALVVCTACGAKPNLMGARVTGRTPVPVRGARCGLFGASSVMVIVPVCSPLLRGLEETRTVHLAPAASVAGVSGQVVV